MVCIWLLVPYLTSLAEEAILRPRQKIKRQHREQCREKAENIVCDKIIFLQFLCHTLKSWAANKVQRGSKMSVFLGIDRKTFHFCSILL